MGNLLDKIKLVSLLADDVWNYFFPPMSGNLQKYLYILGVSAIALKSVSQLYHLYRYWGWIPDYLTNYKNLNAGEFADGYGKGSWAVITGFSSGLGFGFTKTLASFGFNLILIDIQAKRAETAEMFIHKYYPNIKTRSIILDLSSKLENLKEVCQSASDVDIGIIISNAGCVYPGPYTDIKLQDNIKSWNLNALAGVYLIAALLPRLRNRPTKSAIINVSSAASRLPVALAGLYSPSKTFSRVFTQAIAIENRDKIDILSYTPLAIRTALTSFYRGFGSLYPEEAAYSSIQQLGRVTSSYGHVYHQIGASFLEPLSDDQLFQFYLKMHSSEK